MGPAAVGRGAMALCVCVGISHSRPAVAASGPTDAGDLTITEFMAQPTAVANYYGEWFEVYNASGRQLDLEGLFVSGADDVGFTVGSSVTVEAGEYFVFGVEDDREKNGGVPIENSDTGSTSDSGVGFYEYDRDYLELVHTGDSIKLEMDGLTIDEVDWSDDSDWDVLPGGSLQVNGNAFDNEWANDLSHNWCDSTNLNETPDGSASWYGSPGEENDWCSSDGMDADGDGFKIDEGDCDDSDAQVNPDAIDGSDGDEYGQADDDADCDGVRDDGDSDDDGDGYAEVAGDCDDSDISTNPDGVESSNDGIDNDCNGCVDDADADGDGWTECPVAEDLDCDDDGEVDISSIYDCDDSDDSIYPCANEVPYDAIDNDCDLMDECDYDGDGYWADPDDVCPSLDDDGDGVLDCCPDSEAPEGKERDCDDQNDAVNPNGVEGNPDEGGAEDGLDNNCDGVVDEPYADMDGDGVKVSEGDCDDDDPTIHPALADGSGTIVVAAEELCIDLIDNDCDGLLNEGCENEPGYASVRGGGFCGVTAFGSQALSSVLTMVFVVLGFVGGRRRDGER